MTKATERQVAFIGNLVAERGYKQPVDFDTLTSGEASGLITSLLAMPRVAEQGRVTEPGVYKTPQSIIYRVQISRQSGNLYAKRLDIDTCKFEFEAGAIRMLRPEWKMTLAEAKAFGVETGICCVCGAFLTDPRSVAEGIGPVCARRV
jgi:hypothetical protein